MGEQVLATQRDPDALLHRRWGLAASTAAGTRISKDLPAARVDGVTAGPDRRSSSTYCTSLACTSATTPCLVPSRCLEINFFSPLLPNENHAPAGGVLTRLAPTAAAVAAGAAGRVLETVKAPTTLAGT